MARKRQEEEESKETESERLMALAESKYKDSDLDSALKLAKRAHRLSPNNDGLSATVTAFTILLGAASRAPPEWYGVLQAEPFSPPGAVKKQYKKLALLLHPDKNPRPASEDAFKLVSQAFRLLSDRPRRRDYDSQLRLRIQNELTGDGENADTFWTACAACRLLHQFERRYLGHSLVCPACGDSFEAVEAGSEKRTKEEEDEAMTLAEFQSRVKRKARKEDTDKKEKKKKKKRREIPKPCSSLAVETRRGLEVMAVEDSDFYDFDKDRVERSFKRGQVWAIYDDDDGMPRDYCLIEELVSPSPFGVNISWLDLQRDAAEDRFRIHVPCGRYKVSRKTSVDSLNIFSHRVDCERAAREAYRIYPRKGSVWALYKDSNPGAVGRSYDIAVFLTTYSEEHGLSMAYLEKVDGFRTVFKRREVGSHAIRLLEKDDVGLFSHQIPARKLSGDEAPKISSDCWELDPASLPEDLIRIGYAS